jgi:hypothetical protein
LLLRRKLISDNGIGKSLQDFVACETKLAILTAPYNFDAAEKDIYLHRGSILKEKFSDGRPAHRLSKLFSFLANMCGNWQGLFI